MASWYCCAVSAIASSIARLSAAEGQTALVLMTTGSAVARCIQRVVEREVATASNSGELADSFPSGPIAKSFRAACDHLRRVFLRTLRRDPRR